MNVNGIANSPVDYTAKPTKGSDGTAAGGTSAIIQHLLPEIETMLSHAMGMSGDTPNDAGSSPAGGSPAGASPAGGSPAGGSPMAASPGGGGRSNNVTSSYNQLMNDLSATGTSKQTLESDAANLQAAMGNSGGGKTNVTNAAQNMVISLKDGTFSTQGSQGALEGAASRDGLQGVDAPQINGGTQNGSYDGASADEIAPGAHGSLGANTHILMDEIKGGAPASQIKSNALALQKEATNAGDTNLAQNAGEIAGSVGGSKMDFNAPSVVQALSDALGSAPNAG